jgi:molybdate transport system substrate-binding protein
MDTLARGFFVGRVVTATGTLICALSISGCGGGTQSKDEIEILCGTSFRAPMEKLVQQYEAATGKRALLVFGGSEDHLPKVKLKATGDVYVTHTPYMQYTDEAGALLRQVDVGYLAPVLVVPKENPKQLARFEDLAREGLRVVLPNPEFSTCGEMVFGLLEKKGIKDAVMQNTGNDLVKHHSMVGNHLQVGARDAGIMWNGVAHNFRDSVDIVALPYEYDEEIQVSVMGLSYSEKRPAVQEFLDFVEKNGADVFREFGYVK